MTRPDTCIEQPRQTCGDQPLTTPISPESRRTLDALYAQEGSYRPTGIRVKEPKCGVIMDDGATAAPPPSIDPEIAAIDEVIDRLNAACSSSASSECRPAASDMMQTGRTLIMDEGGSACASVADAAAYNAVKDSGVRQNFDTGSRRDSRDGKGRYDLLPVYALKRLARHFENGAKKYTERNWERGQPLSRYLDSAIRHAFEFLGGSRDEDHAAAAAWNILCMIETEQRIREGRLPLSLDDLPYPQKSAPVSDELIERLSAAAIVVKRDEGDWQTCDLLREARNELLRIKEAR